MKTRLTLRPGQDGTHKQVEKYGDRLLYVRYRYDAEQQRRLKTVELIEEEVPWSPVRRRFSRDALVSVRVLVNESEVQRQVKRAGGKWDARQRVWHVTYAKVKELGMEDRIVVEDDGSERAHQKAI